MIHFSYDKHSIFLNRHSVKRSNTTNNSQYFVVILCCIINPMNQYFVKLIDGKYHHKIIDHLDNDIEDMILDRILYYARC